MILGGVVGAAGSGMFVDRTKLYEETMKVCLGMAVVFGLIFLQLTLHTNLKFFIASTCFLFGILGLATYPVGLELASECTFPVSEATSTGLIVLSGQVSYCFDASKILSQVQSVIYVFIMKYFARPLAPSKWEHQVCQLDANDMVNIPQDNTVSILVSFSFCFSTFSTYVVFAGVSLETMSKTLSEK